MTNNVSFYRGMRVNTAEEAIKKGLVVPNLTENNEVSSHIPPGLFFLTSAHRQCKSLAEYYAGLTNTDRPVSLAIHFTVTESTFPLLQNRMHRIDDDGGPNKKESFILIRSFEDLKIPSNMALINLSGLSHEDLVELGVMVGIKKSEVFIYRPYEAWTVDLGVRAMSREELKPHLEGRNPYERK